MGCIRREEGLGQTCTFSAVCIQGGAPGLHRILPFELLYHPVRGPLDILRELWEASKHSSESTVSYVLSIQEKLARISTLAQWNLVKAQVQGMTKHMGAGVPARRAYSCTLANLNTKASSQVAGALSSEVPC